MSGQFVQFWTQRITQQEMLLVHQELKNILCIDKSQQKIGWIQKDYYGNTNLFLPNPIQEKTTYWDIDTFLYYTHDKYYQQYLSTINNHTQILQVKKNDKTYSLLFKSNEINKLVQIDLHIVQNTPLNLKNYFNYYRIPYLFFILGLMFNRINIKLWIKWVYYVVHIPVEEWSTTILSKYVMLEKYFIKFLTDFYEISKQDIFSITSYQQIIDLLTTYHFSDYNFFKDIQKYEYRVKLAWNEKLQQILSSLPEPTKTVQEFKDTFHQQLYDYYPFLNKHIEQVKQDYYKSQIQKQQRTETLQYLFNTDNLKTLTKEQNKTVSIIINNLSEFKILKEMSNKCMKEYGYPLYLVGWAVRDMLLGIKLNDFDVTSALTPQQFTSTFGWIITEKFWTVFYTYKGLEIEYTPFRVESWSNWRKPDTIQFSTNIEDDVKRRDFTINSLYLDLHTFTIIDLVGWQQDLRKWVIRTVGDPNDRFQEDYLRILRAIRLASKLHYTIDNNTYDAMILNSKGIDKLSIQRILEEYFKGFNLPNKGWQVYMSLLDKYYHDIKNHLNIIINWKKYNTNEIYSLFYYLCNYNNDSFKKILGKHKWQKYNCFLIANSIIHKQPNIQFTTQEDLLRFLLFINIHNLSKIDYKWILISLWNQLIQQNKLTKEQLQILLEYKKMFDKKKINYFQRELYKGIDVKEYCESNSINISHFKSHIIETYIESIRYKL